MEGSSSSSAQRNLPEGSLTKNKGSYCQSFFQRLYYSMWLFHLHSAVEHTASFPVFPLARTTAKAFCRLSLWSFKEKKHQPFSITQPFQKCAKQKGYSTKTLGQQYREKSPEHYCRLAVRRQNVWLRDWGPPSGQRASCSATGGFGGRLSSLRADAYGFCRVFKKRREGFSPGGPLCRAALWDVRQGGTPA
mgnify:CR=1 FL=1